MPALGCLAPKRAVADSIIVAGNERSEYSGLLGTVRRLGVRRDPGILWRIADTVIQFSPRSNRSPLFACAAHALAFILRNQMTRFKNKILFVGYGAVAECTLPILFKHLKVAPENVTVMDFEDRSEKLKKWTAKGVRFVRDRVTVKNMGALLGAYVGAGDVIIDEFSTPARMH